MGESVKTHASTRVSRQIVQERRRSGETCSCRIAETVHVGGWRSPTAWQDARYSHPGMNLVWTSALAP